MAATKGTEARWRAVVREQEASGESVADFARSCGISPATLYWWRWVLKRRRGSTRRGPRLAEITVLSAGGVEGRLDAPEFELVLGGGRRLRVPSAFDSEALHRLIGVLERRC
jgi:transposase-like protein